jgi:hypothetical protein
MPSTSYREWMTTRAEALDEIEQAHAAVGGTGRGRRYATQQINRAYVVLLSSQFQGFCRDLHSEGVDHLIAAIAPPAALRPLVQAEFTRGRQLDKGNAQPDSLNADFGRFGINFWTEMESFDARNRGRRTILKTLNDWRNAIAHQNFDPGKLGGRTTIQLGRVRQWRTSCRHLAHSLDEVMRNHLQALTGTPPW